MDNAKKRFLQVKAHLLKYGLAQDLEFKEISLNYGLATEIAFAEILGMVGIRPSVESKVGYRAVLC